MDRLEALGSQLSQITLYDIKSVYNQAKNIVLNVSEMEAKVREATNEDPWGASSTLMQEIAQGTFNFQNFNEIMPCIYSRFLEKETSQWRQIYKALQLLEYIIKHGSERVVDDARAHISTIKMLRNFHYIDAKAKDQGINVRTRAKEIVELLGDLDRVRAERRKAKANRNKYTGTGNDFTTGGNRYGGFGNEGVGGDYSSGGAGGDEYYNGGTSSFRDDALQSTFDEYDAGEYEGRSSRSTVSPSRLPTASNSRVSRNAPAPVLAQETKATVTAVQETDLLGGFAAENPVTGGPHSSKPLPTPSALVSLDDDFDDFQSAPPSAPAAAVGPHSPARVLPASESSANVFSVVSTATIASSTPPLLPASNVGWSNPPMHTVSSPSTIPSYNSNSPSGTASGSLMRPGVVPTSSKPSSSSDFGDLWNLGFGGGVDHSISSANAAPVSNKSIKDLEREKMEAGMWGNIGRPVNIAPKPTTSGAQERLVGSSDNDLLL